METTPKSAQEEAKAEEVATEPELAKSTVDGIFDAITARTVRGLVLAKSALETVARFLEGRAKVVGDLATKLALPSDSQTKTSEAVSSTQESSPASP